MQRLAEALEARGLGTTVSVQLARRSTAQAAFDIAQATAARHDATNTLLQTLELPSATRLLVQDSFDRPLARSAVRTVERVMEDSLRQRADLLADLARLRATDAGIAETRAGMAPKLLIDGNVQGSIGRISVDGGRYEGIEQPQAGVFLRVEWPFFQGGLEQNRVRLAESRRAAAEDALQAASSAALHEVASAYDQVATSLSQTDAALALQAASQTAYGSASEAFAHGVGAFFDAVNAATALSAASAAVAKAHAQALINAAGLAFTAGEFTSAAVPSIAGIGPQ